MDEKIVGSISKENKKSLSHFLVEEIFYQPEAMLSLLQSHLSYKKVVLEAFGERAPIVFGRVHRIQIITTAENYYAGLMARFWLEEISGIPCQVEKASEYTLRVKVVESNKLCVFLSATGEEPETIAALHAAKDLGYIAILAICNVALSTLVRESDLVLMTNSKDFSVGKNLTPTQTFTAQLAGLFLLSIALGRYHRLDEHSETILVKKLEILPDVLKRVLELNTKIETFGEVLSERNQAIYLGRDVQLPIAMEGAYKLKELSHMDANAYSPEEFRARPLGSARSLGSVVSNLPVVSLVPSYDFFDEWKVIFQDFRHQQFDVFVFSDKKIDRNDSVGIKIAAMPPVDRYFAPMVYTIPMQLLACYTTIHKDEDT